MATKASTTKKPVAAPQTKFVKKVTEPSTIIDKPSKLVKRANEPDAADSSKKTGKPSKTSKAETVAKFVDNSSSILKPQQVKTASTSITKDSQGKGEVKQSEKTKKRTTDDIDAAVVVDTSKRPDTAVMRLASEALLQHVREFEKAKKQKALALPGVSKDSQSVFLQIGLRNMPEQALKTFKGRPIILPHPFRDIEDTSVCMFVKDKAEAKKWLGDDYEKQGVKKIISLEQLRKEYKAYQDRRDLAALYDAFVADDRIVCMLPKTLGKAFFSGPKRPLPIRLAQNDKVSGNTTEKVQKALKSAYFYLSGMSTSIRIGNTTQSAEEIAANIEATIEGSLKHIPGQWKGVQSIFIKSEKSAALPLYEGQAGSNGDA